MNNVLCSTLYYVDRNILTAAIPPYCGFVDNTTTKYWQHNCNPLTFPMDDLPIKMMCRMQPSDLGDFQCYFSQEDAMMGSLGMKCRTGEEIYYILEIFFTSTTTCNLYGRSRAPFG